MGCNNMSEIKQGLTRLSKNKPYNRTLNTLINEPFLHTASIC